MTDIPAELRPSRRRRGAPGPGEQGIALLVTILVLMVVSLLGAAVITQGRVDYEVSANYRSSLASLYLADSAFEETIADLRGDIAADPLDNWLNDWIDLSASPPAVFVPFPDVEGTEVNGSVLQVRPMSPNPFMGTPYELGAAVPLGDGILSRVVWLPPTVAAVGANGASFRVELRTRARGASTNVSMPSSVEVDAIVGVDVKNVSPWNNAMMLGGGLGGRLIAGSVEIAGSLHAVGDGAVPATLDFTSGSKLTNNYGSLRHPVFGIGPLAAKVPALGTVDFNGDTVTSLDAELRLQDGRIDLGPLGALGEADRTGNAVKETLDAIYSDGPINGSGVHADRVAGYDLDAVYDFPSLAGPFVDPDTGIGYSSFSTWLEANAFAPVGADLVIDATTPSFSWSDPFGKGAIVWDATRNLLAVDGIVKIDGDLFLSVEETVGLPGGGRGGGRGAGRGGGLGGAGGGLPGSRRLATIEYAGSGVLYATGNIEVHADVYPAGQYMQDGDGDGRIDGNLGLLAARDVLVATGALDPDLTVMAAIFADGVVRFGTAAKVVGSVAAPHVAVDTGVLKLWHVPRLGTRYPRGLPVGRRFAIGDSSIKEWFQRR